jgi:Carboxypeptidase regulatory-like domain
MMLPRLNSRVTWGLVALASTSAAAIFALTQRGPTEGAPKSGESQATPTATSDEDDSLFVGAVTNVDGTPLAGAKILVEHVTLAKQFSGRSQVSGRFSVDVPEGPVRVTIEHPGHATIRSQEVLTLPVFRSYALSARSSIAGRLTSHPAEDPRSDLRAVVRLVNADGSMVASTESQSDGSFSFSDVPPGNYVVLAWTQGLSAATNISPAGGLETRIEVPLEPSRLWTVRTEAAAATLDVQGGLWRSRSGEAASLKEGRAVFDLPADVSAYARLSAPGRATTLRPVTDVSDAPLVPGASLQGRLVAAAGSVPSGIPVTMTWLDSKRGEPVLQHETVTGAQGEYSFAGLQGGAHELRIKHPRFGLLIENVTLRAGSTERLETKLEPTAYVAGRMVDAAGLPQPGEPVAFAAGDVGFATGVTDAQGAFRLGPVFPAKGMLVALESSDVQANQLVAPGLNPDAAHVEFRVPGKSTKLSLRIGDAQGAALEGVEVRVRSPKFGGPRESFPVYLEPLARSDGSGSVTLEYLAATEQDLWLNKAGYAPQRVDVNLSSTVPTMMAVLERAGGLVLEPQGQLAEAAQSPAAAACRFVVSPEGPSALPVIDRVQPCTSPFKAEDLYPSRYTVHVFSGGSVISASAEVTSGRRSSIRGAWSRAQALTGSLVKSTRRPCADCLVRDDTRGIYTNADAKGAFSLFGYTCGESIALSVSQGGEADEEHVQFALECSEDLTPKTKELTLGERVAAASNP